MKTFFAVFFVALMLLFSGCLQQQKACTLEAKACSDGSFVSRNPEFNCEFDACPGEIKILLDKNNYFFGEQISFSISNNSLQPVFLPGCNSFSLQKLSNEKWIDIAPLKQCVWEGIAIEIKAGEQKQHSFEASQLQSGTYRTVVLASQNCLQGKPLSQANCTKTTSIFSLQFSITESNPTECSTNADCVLVNAGCCGCNQGGKRTAINKNFEQSHQQELELKCVGIVCIQLISNDASCSARARAVCGYPQGRKEGTCTTVLENPYLTQECDNLRDKFQKTLDAINYCDSNSDCKVLDLNNSSCLFQNCTGFFYNKAIEPTINEIQKELDAVNNACEHKCLLFTPCNKRPDYSKIECTDKKCFFAEKK